MKNADLPAMPQNNSETLCQSTGTPHYMHSGLTKREYFAGFAMQGLCTAMLDEKAREFVICRAKEIDCEPKNALAKISAQYADALLAELEREK